MGKRGYQLSASSSIDDASSKIGRRQQPVVLSSMYYSSFLGPTQTNAFLFFMSELRNEMLSLVSLPWRAIIITFLLKFLPAYHINRLKIFPWTQKCRLLFCRNSLSVLFLS
ncbi:hypothetical protein V8C34DRAFT_291091 [Trichoderma compactum]